MADAPILRIFLIVFREFVGDDLKFRRRGGKLHAGLEPDEGKPVIVLGARGHGGQVDVRVTPGEARWHYANDGVELVIELDRFVEDVAAATELVLPEKVAEHGDGCGITAGRVGSEEFATEERLGRP